MHTAILFFFQGWIIPCFSYLPHISSWIPIEKEREIGFFQPLFREIWPTKPDIRAHHIIWTKQEFTSRLEILTHLYRFTFFLVHILNLFDFETLGKDSLKEHVYWFKGDQIRVQDLIFEDSFILGNPDRPTQEHREGFSSSYWQWGGFLTPRIFRFPYFEHFHPRSLNRDNRKHMSEIYSILRIFPKL